MYNRYIPQPDGSYRRSRLPEPQPPKPAPKPPAPPPSCPPEVHHEPLPPAPPPKRPPPKHTDINGFLRQLLPKDFDTGDLMVVLLLLLMAGDCPENQSNALLTLALYLFL